MFNFVDRGRGETLVLIPGWGFDCQIFDKLDLDYNYFLYTGNLKDFNAALLVLLNEKKLSSVSLLGWSHGAFVAGAFAGQNPDLVDKIILISLRRKYLPAEIESTKKSIEQNLRAFLIKFYKECFTTEENSAFSWFKQKLMPNYLNAADKNKLLENLTLLGQQEAHPALLGKIKKLTLVHGKGDRIAPITEAIEVAKNLPRVNLIAFENTGHLPFLAKDFKERLNHA